MNEIKIILDSRNERYSKDMIVNRINEKLTEYLEKYTHTLSEVYVSEEIVLEFTLEDSADVIEISGTDIKYYAKNNADDEILSVYELVYHDLVRIEELYQNKSQELKNLLLFLEDKDGMIKKQIIEVLMEHKKKREVEEIGKYSYEEEMHDLLFEDYNINDDNLK